MTQELHLHLYDDFASAQAGQRIWTDPENRPFWMTSSHEFLLGLRPTVIFDHTRKPWPERVRQEIEHITRICKIPVMAIDTAP